MLSPVSCHGLLVLTEAIHFYISAIESVHPEMTNFQVVRIDYLDSQIPSADDYLIDPDYPTDSWLN